MTTTLKILKTHEKYQDHTKTITITITIIVKESQSLSNSNQSSPTVQQSYEPVINPSIVFKSPIPIASCRITRSKLSKVVELQKITKIPHKETAKQAKKDELESISVDKPKRGRPKKITKALQFDT